jgi:uncharacterized membrane protein
MTVVEIIITVFRVFLPLVVIYAFLRGSRDEQYVGIICVIGTLATSLVLSPVAERYQSVEMSVIAVDLGVLAGFVLVALRSTRFWPLWVAGLQLTAVMGHFLKGIDNHLLPRAYGVALGFWAYPIVIILAVCVWRTERRARAERRQTIAG